MNSRSESQQEWRIAALFSFVAVLCCGLLNLIVIEGLSDRGIFFLYFLGFTLLPVTLYGIQRYSGFFTKAGGITFSGWAALFLNLFFCFKMTAPERIDLLSGTYCLIMAYLLLLVLRAALFKNNRMEVHLSPRYSVMVSAAIFGVALLGFLNTFVEHLWFDRVDGIAARIPQWGGWPAVVVGVFAVVSAYVLWWRKAKSTDANAGWTLWVCASPILLFSLQSSFDLDHYDAFVAPAIAVLHGRIPLMDVFSQYGLGYLLFTLAFLVLPNTYAVCASIVSLMNIGSFVVYLLMLRNLIKNPTVFALLGLSSVFGVYFFNSMSINAFPSTLGFRYLPAIFFVYFLLRAKSNEENRLNTRSNVGFLLFNALWSIECLVFYFLIAGFYRWLMTRSIKKVFQSLFKLFLQLFVGVLIFFVIYYLFFKRFPNYAVYFEYPLTYLTGSRGNASFSQHVDPLTSRYLFIFPLFLVSSLVFYWSVFEKNDSTTEVVLNKLFLLNFSGIVFFVYIAVHAFVFFAKLEFVMLLFPFFAAAWLVAERSRYVIFKLLSRVVLWLTSVVFFCVFVTNVVYTKPFNAGANDSLVYNLIHFDEKVFKNFWYNVNHFCNKKNYKKNNSSYLFNTLNDACQKYDFRQEVKGLVDKYFKDKNDMLMFSTSVVEILFENHKYHPVIVSPLSDETLDATQNKIVEDKVNEVQLGNIVIVDKNIGLDGFNSGVLRKLGSRFIFNKIDETPHLWVFKLDDNTGGRTPSFLSKQHFVTYLGANGVVNRGRPSAIQDAKIPLYFYNGDTLTVEMVFDTPFLMDGIKLWHLLGNRDLLKYRFFSNNAIKTFNVLVSMDGEKWEMVASEANYFMNDKKYYYKDISPIFVKYMRLNALIDSPYIALSTLEVFEKDK